MFRDKTYRGLRSYSRPILCISIVAVVLMSQIVLAEEDGTIIVQQNEEVTLLPCYGRCNKTKNVYFDWKRWKPVYQAITKKNKVADLFKGRCLLLVESGELRFKEAQMSDSGNYSLEVYDHHGKLQCETLFMQLLVIGQPQSQTQLNDNTVSSFVITVAVVTGFISLLITSIIFLTLRKKRQQGMMTEDPREENVYVVMGGDHGERTTEKEGRSLEEEGEEESPYVICASIKPTTTRTSVSSENIYEI